MDAVALDISAGVSNEGKDENDAAPEAIGGNEASEAEGVVDDDGESDDLEYNDAVAGAASEKEAKSVDEKDDGALVVEEVAVGHFAIKPSFADGLELKRIAAVGGAAVVIVIGVEGGGTSGTDENEERGDKNTEYGVKNARAMPLEKLLRGDEGARSVNLSLRFSLHGIYLSIDFSWQQVGARRDWRGQPSQSG